MKSLKTMMLALMGTAGASLGLAPATARADVSVVIVTSDGRSGRCGGYDQVVYRPRDDCRRHEGRMSQHRGRTWGDCDYRERSGRIGRFVEARHVRKHRIVHRKRVVVVRPSRPHHRHSYTTARRHHRQAGRFLSRW